MWDKTYVFGDKLIFSYDLSQKISFLSQNPHGLKIYDIILSKNNSLLSANYMIY